MAQDSKLTPAAQAALGYCWAFIMFRGHATCSCTVAGLEWWPQPWRLPNHSATPVAHTQAEGLVQISPCPDLWRYTFSGT